MSEQNTDTTSPTPTGLRWGILGTGGISTNFTGDMIDGGFPVVAVGSRSTESAERFAQEHDIARAHGSYADLAADPEVDAVYIGTPHPFHAENAVQMLEAGKHVLVEKPFTINEAEARLIADTATRVGKVALEAMWTRFLPHMIRVREIVASGVLGELRSVVGEHCQDLPDDPSHRLNDLALGGGALLDLGIYPISFTWDILGAPERIMAAAVFKDTGADAQTTTLFQYASGATSSTVCASDAAGANRASIVGTEGRLDFEPTFFTPTVVRHVVPGGAVVEEIDLPVEGRGMRYQAAELERLAAAGLISGDILPLEESVAIMGTLDAIRAQTGLTYPGESAPGVPAARSSIVG
ncbi:putative dehydrogenase [Labedella gwakjiensis]|uniref:Gfo/Idh/MocA family oxidoreductase n=1 Tax=Labedella gwakjiensis TaxID=390269 RepID=A0A2P8GXL2_9MICO|nr:Gfo/Idh/MocA family oxidoreductase [Labedella gwakjiensis]PSL38699.1 putative dehydrogenase [Labedella gwakjiensis]RUQ86807.1 Gfo/Idh/MocA family oxidoreductase [Labedella gwakjiensis]